MDFSSLVLMEKDMENNSFVRELGSFKAVEGAQYITKLFYDGQKVNLFFDTIRDVEDWEFNAIYDMFDIDAFTEKGFQISEKDDEFNPTWIVLLSYEEEHGKMQEMLEEVSIIINETMNKVFEDIKEKEEEYKL